MRKNSVKNCGQSLVELALVTGLVWIVGGIALTQTSPEMLRNAVVSSVSSDTGVNDDGSITINAYGEKSNNFSVSTVDTTTETVSTDLNTANYEDSDITGLNIPLTLQRNVYVFGNLYYPVSTRASSEGSTDYSVTLKSEMLAYHNELELKNLFNNLSDEAQQVSNNYGGMFSKTVVIDDYGELIGTYSTSEIMNLNQGIYGVNEYNGKELTLPDIITKYIVNISIYHSPLTFDLNNDGIKTTAKLVKFDLTGDGKADTINDTNDGILCINGGKSGKDLFGNKTDLGNGQKFSNGFEALKALAKQKNITGDVLSAKDFEKMGLKIKIGGYNGKVVSLKSLGITEISLGSTEKTTIKQNFDSQNNDLMEQSATTFKINGKTAEYADIWHTLK